ncbi:hypothetical protein OH456_06050 [Vibrio sp. La 4.2.2]|uniref:GapS4a family protein n=1 Tax=Vibrio sp. La 4.2.2 TaxID=2998830 RepID=UPI0022CE28B6|nr:hypothetical protein [Vibrio sp. La 4.2.2]MDA0107697.1 hypothetical protein [Vibrio sp. La 4.2.2]
MGELSKSIGEHGEKVVRNFLEVIGWSGAQEGESLACSEPQKHKRKQDSDRKTHGIDLFYSSKSQLQDYTLDNVIISVKYTSKPYPSNPSATFKSHIKDLAQTIECFMCSELRSENNESYEMTGISQACDTGVLFWLTNDRSSDQDVVSKVSSVQIEKDLEFGAIHIVDNNKASFIYDSITYIENKFTEDEIYFHYAFGSSNYNDPSIQKYGKVLPVEYLTSNILPFRVVSNNKVKFCISCSENFSEGSISRLLSLASDVSLEFTNEFIFLFPDYDPLSHESVVKKSTRLLAEKANHVDISVYSYENDFRGLINER